jgi:nucleoside-diphosphate-sugar epimerase
MNVLVIGGTRNVGHHLVRMLLWRRHRVTMFNRGTTPDGHPAEVERLRGDRSDPEALARALAGREFDACVDTIAMRGSDTAAALHALDARVGHYVHFSTGQVYLVREGVAPPARETDYDGPLIPPPPAGSWEEPEWRYGVEKRECEDLLAARPDFPSTRLRLPMIHGPRDHYARIHGYLLRLADGGPVLATEEPAPPIRHIHQSDVVRTLMRLVEKGEGKGEAYNLSMDDEWTLEAFLERLAGLAGAEPRIVRRPRAALVEAGLFPACSPFSNPWMSVLDNAKAKRELKLQPRGLDDWLPDLVRALRDRPAPEGWAERRARELALAG